MKMARLTGPTKALSIGSTFAILSLACGDGGGPTSSTANESFPVDSGSAVIAKDAGTHDPETHDAETLDSETYDSEIHDAATQDAETYDSGTHESGTQADGGRLDGGPTKDAGTDSSKPAADSGGSAPIADCAFDGDYDSASNKYPPGGCYPWYPKSVFFKKLPANPVLDPNSRSYNAAQGYNSGGVPQLLGFGAGQASEPVYFTHGGGINLKINCGLSGSIGWGVSDCQSNTNTNGSGQSINLNGATLNFPPNFAIEQAGDAHMSRIDSTFQDEFESWASEEPSNISNGQTFDVGAAGLCDLNEDGVGCSHSTATNLPYSLGLVRAEDLLACLDSAAPSCTLPYAMAWAPICNSHRYVYPATWSDAQCYSPQPADDVLPPEGARGFLAMTDAQVNALNVPAYEKIYLRTIDQEHFGFVDTDTGWGESTGTSPQSQGYAPYTQYGNPNPWVELGQRVGVTPGSDSISFPLSADGIDMLNDIKWCLPTSSGLCDGQGSGPTST